MESYEFGEPNKLKTISDRFFNIPCDIICAKELGEKRLTVFSYFSVRRGLNSEVTFSINDIVRWSGRKPDRHLNGINDKVERIIDYLCEQRYLGKTSIPKHSSMVSANFNLGRIQQACDTERFAVIYTDELAKIISCPVSLRDTYHNVDVILLVFAYLRMKIYKRRNRLFPEEINVQNKNDYFLDIEARRMRAPEAYDDYFSDIALELGLTDRAVSAAVAALNELGLIYFETLPRIKRIDEYGNEKWRTDHTIFCNTYKREMQYLLAFGSEYYMQEIRNKKLKLHLLSEDRMRRKQAS